MTKRLGQVMFFGAFILAWFQAFAIIPPATSEEMLAARIIVTTLSILAGIAVWIKGGEDS